MFESIGVETFTRLVLCRTKANVLRILSVNNTIRPRDGYVLRIDAVCSVSDSTFHSIITRDVSLVFRIVDLLLLRLHALCSFILITVIHA